MIGGYKMIDLTGATAGDPVTIDGIFNRIKNNNTKPILIKANDGQDVFAQVKEVDGDYVLTYLSAEGKTVKVVIDDEDSVTTTIADDAASIEALTQAVNEISTDVQTLQKVGVSSSFTMIADHGSTLPVTFTCPSDGYIRHYNDTLPSSGNVQTCYAKENGDTTACMIGILSAGSSVGGVSGYVRKGQKIVVSTNSPITGGTFNVRFYPFES